jgi:hypothetical protein
MRESQSNHEGVCGLRYPVFHFDANHRRFDWFPVRRTTAKLLNLA